MQKYYNSLVNNAIIVGMILSARVSETLYTRRVTMNGRRIKDVVMGAIVAGLVVGAVPVAFAKVGGVSIPVTYNNIKIVVDGKEVKSDKEPFTYEGTTYLPVRAVAEAVGKEVKWDSTTQTVTLTSTKEEVKEEVKEDVKKEVKEEIKEEVVPYVNEKIVYSGNDIEVSYKGQSSREYSSGKELNFVIKNMSERDITVQVRKFHANGETVDTIFYCDIPAGKTVADDITITGKSLAANEITSIEEVDFEFHVFDDNDWNFNFDSGLIRFKA